MSEVVDIPEVIKTVERDIQDLGELGLLIIQNIGQQRKIMFESCLGDTDCMACINECPEGALQMEAQEDGYMITIDLALCDGVACRRCERACKAKVFNLVDLITSIPETKS